MALTFYTNPMSRGRIARWMLEEVGAPYETVVLDYATTMKGEAYRSINPMGKVPAIVHDGHVLTEGAAICAYLADAFPEAGLAPPLGERADYYRWLFFAAGPVEHAVTNKSLGVTPTDDQQRMAGYGHFDLTVDVLEKAVSANPYIAGESFSAADVYAGSQVAWGVMFGSLPKRAAFEDYLGRILSRPAYKRAGEIDDALIAQAGAAG
ncbi:glutathione S-transferase family protein [Sphingomonas sp. 10B4]|uniref:glutathione S-transferase family protein n=1 Tax=Sphingomonas sp. 10B4 TaxID=3048575 RepID=UPI002AB3D356|nr:glutathione S-transferase family protein [Sphingomonas sp. 10B4]MDY7523359.1 glutathione S-transferase family protein [Sphingomonas sp. 10B4]MEB0281057.1 glutathione S-transferase family protein [Sphingomonas sp. 10B4]